MLCHFFQAQMITCKRNTTRTKEIRICAVSCSWCKQCIRISAPVLFISHSLSPNVVKLCTTSFEQFILTFVERAIPKPPETPTQITRSGRAVKANKRFLEDMEVGSSEDEEGVCTT